jgi:CBS domain containing-hemolysin-like protein
LPGYIRKNHLISAILMALLTFFIALLLSIGSEGLVKAANQIAVAVLLLILIIFVGIFFDMIGTAVTAAELPPFNAKAAKKIYGARQAVKLIHNAGLVANFCGDVVGDISGTLSGAIGAGIAISLMKHFPLVDAIWVGSAITSLIAAATVGGKALGKHLAVNYANQIIFRVAIVISWWEDLTGMELFKK